MLAGIVLLLSACKKPDYSFGELTAPSNLSMTATVVGVNASNPNGNGTGNVTITVASTGALTYNIDFGDGITRVVPSGTLTYKYANPGTNDYTITVNAVGTGGSITGCAEVLKARNPNLRAIAVVHLIEKT